MEKLVFLPCAFFILILCVRLCVFFKTENEKLRRQLFLSFNLISISHKETSPPHTPLRLNCFFFLFSLRLAETKHNNKCSLTLNKDHSNMNHNPNDQIFAHIFQGCSSDF